MVFLAGRPTGTMPCTGDDPNLDYPSSGLLWRIPSWCLQSVGINAVLDVTGIQGLRLSPVSDCRGHRGSSRLRRRAGMAWEVLGLLASGICCRGGSVPDPSQESHGGRRNWAGYPGCWGGASGDGRKLSMKPMMDRQTTT